MRYCYDERVPLPLARLIGKAQKLGRAPIAASSFLILPLRLSRRDNRYKRFHQAPELADVGASQFFS